MARLKAVSGLIAIAAAETIEETHRIFVRTAKEEHGKVMSADPVPGLFKRYVDGAIGKVEDDVSPHGVIFYTYDRLDAVVRYALATLKSQSPVLSGRYRDSHRLFVDGVEVETLATWQPGEEIAITNFVPYARKIEVGAMEMRVPGTEGVYYQTNQIVRRRWGNVADIRFTYRGLVGNGVLANPKSGSAAVRRGEHNRSDLRYPVLIIAPKGTLARRVT